MNQKYEFVNIKPQGSILLFIMLIIDLILFSASFVLWASISTIFTLAVLIQPSGFIIDKENNQIKIVKGIISLRLGKWKKLPEVKYVSLLRVKHIDNLHQTNPALYRPKTTNSSNYLVNLIIKENWQKERPVKLISTSQKNAIAEGLKLGEYLNLKVLDQTTHEKRWIR
jgi:hypothetical protein